MKKLAILTAMAALLVVSTQPQAAEAKHHRTYSAVVPGYYSGYNSGYYSGYNYGNPYGYNNYGGATVFPDGSFSNNGYSWNGADPTGGATGLSNHFRAAHGLPLLPGMRW